MTKTNTNSYICIYLIPQTAATSGSSTSQSLVTKIGSWGGNGGSDVDVRVPPHHLESMVIRHGVVVDSIGFSYLDQAGRKHAAGPWGGNGGNITTVSITLHFPLSSSVYLETT